MTRILTIAMTLIVGLVVLTGVKAISDLNDGRVQLVVKQIMTPQLLNAEAKQVLKRKQ